MTYPIQLSTSKPIKTFNTSLGDPSQPDLTQPTHDPIPNPLHPILHKLGPVFHDPRRSFTLGVEMQGVVDQGDVGYPGQEGFGR